MEAINLLPAGAIRHNRWGAADASAAKRVLVTAAAVAGVVIVASGAAFFQAHRTVSDRQATLNGLEQQVAVAQAGDHRGGPVRQVPPQERTSGCVRASACGCGIARGSSGQTSAECGSRVSAVTPPYQEWRSCTLMPCRWASLPTT